MDPERPIEKLLRASARQRRDEAGAPFELHPATRRWLQGEVARRFGRPQRARGRFTRSDRWFWPKLAWGLGAATVLAMVMALLVPSLHHRPAETLLAENKQALESPPARRPAAPAPEPAIPVVAGAPAGAKSKAATDEEIRYSQADKDAAAGTLLAQREQSKTESAVRAPVGGSMVRTTPPAGIAGEQKRLVAENSPSKVNPSAAAPTSAAEPPAVPPAIPIPPVTNYLAFKKPFAQTAGLGTGRSAVQRFARVRLDTETQDARRKQASPGASVLVWFQLEQSGQEVRIVDKDGSVYTGSLLAADLADHVAPSDGAKPATAGVQRVAAAQDKIVPATTPAKPPLSSNFQQAALEYGSFRVIGTNLTLKQRVVFSGKLFGVANAPAAARLTNAWSGAGANRSGAASPAPGQAKAAPLFPSRIVGQVIVGRSQAVQINAVPIP